MVKYIFILILVTYNIQLLYTQSFSGKLIYLYTTNDYTNADIYEMAGKDYELYGRNTKEKFLINNDTLISFEYKSDGVSKEQGLKQFKNNAFLYDTKNNQIINYDKIYKNGLDYNLLKKTNDKDIILEKICTKYIYSNNNFPSETIYAWIPDDYNFPDSYGYGKFFRLFFFNQGLAFRKEIHFNGTTRIWTLIFIEKY